MDVLPCHIKRGVTQDALKGKGVPTGSDELHRKKMPELMWASLAGSDTSLPDDPPHLLLGSLDAQRVARREKEDMGNIRGCCCLLLVDVAFEGGFALATEGNRARAGLSRHFEMTFRPDNIPKFQVARFTDANAGGHEHLDKRLIPKWCPALLSGVHDLHKVCIAKGRDLLLAFHVAWAASPSDYG